MPPDCDLGSAGEEGSSAWHVVAATSSLPHQKCFFQPAPLEQVCHPPWLVMGVMHTFEILK